MMRTQFYILILLLLPALECFSQTCSWIVGDTSLNNPEWLSCTGSTYTIYLQPDSNTGVLIVDWADGTIDTVSGGLSSSSFLSHSYPDSVVTYNIVISDTTNNCISYGTLIQEEQTNSSIELPLGTNTSVTCAPGIISYINNSTDVSPNTFFEWDFGDGTPAQSFNYTNAGDTMDHMYMPGTVECATIVSLEAYNLCNINNPSTATFNPINIYEKDEAIIEPDFTTLCYPDTIVHYESEPIKNCINDGNTAQRLEKWNFGDYWGLGVDSIIDWVPCDPPNVPGHDVSYPGIGTYVAYLFDSSRCGVDNDSVVIQITSPPTAEVNLAQDSVCQGSAAAFSHSNGGVQNTINYGDDSIFYNFSSTSYHTYSSPGSYQITAVSKILGASSACSDTAYDSITVMPLPNPQFTRSPIQGCDSLQVTFINNSTGATSFNWNLGFGNTSSSFTPPVVSYTTAGQHWITLQAVTSFGCVKSLSNWVKVFASPVASFSAPSGCEDSPVSFSNLSTTGYGGSIISRLWSFGDSANSTSNLNNPSFTYSDSGIYEIELVVNTQYCHDTVLGNVQIEPKPITEFQKSDSSGCSPLSVTFSNQSTGANSYSWNFGDGNTSTQQSPTYTFVHTSLSDTFYVVKLVAMSTFGCLDSVSDTIVVMGNPVSSFVSDAVLDCAPLEVNFTDSSSVAINWMWDFGDSTGSTAQNPTHTFENTTQFITNYTVNLIVTAPNGCTDTSSESIAVYPEPLYNFTMVPDQGCSPLVVQFPVVVGAVLYDWDFGDGNTGSGPNPTHTFYNNTTNNQSFVVTLIATTPFGCIDTAYGTVTVFPNPTAVASPTLTQECGPFTVNFTNASTGGSVYTWIFGNGDTLVSGSATVNSEFTNNTNDTAFYHPLLIATTLNGCNDTDTVDVHIFKQVISSFSVNDSSCYPHAATFTDLSVNASSWLWDFDDGFGSTQQHPQHTFINLGTVPVVRQVLLTAGTIEGCTKDSIVDVTILPKPSSSFNLVNSPACHGEPVQINNNSLQNLINSWQFGAGAATFVDNAGTIDTVFNNFTSTTSTRTITLLVENAYGCTDTSDLEMVVYPFLEAKFAAANDGCSPLEVKFFNMSTGGNLFEWAFGDGNNSFFDEPTHTFVNMDSLDVTFTVTLEVQSIFGCTDEAELDITVRATPAAQFIVNPTFQRFPDSTVTLDNLSSDGPWSYHWQFGDGDTSALAEPMTHGYATWGEYTILLTAMSEFCEDTISRDITIEPPFPIAVFDTLIIGCAPITVDFLSNSQYANTWLWEFGDGAASSSANPTYTYQFPGSYDVKLTVTGPGGDKDSEEALGAVVVNAQPLASFVHAPNEVRVPSEPVTFVNYSQFADNYFWDFGDTITSTEENPQHYYKEAGNFFPILVASTNEGCIDTMISTIPVVGLVEGMLEIPNAFIPSPTGASDGLFDPFAVTNEVFFPILTGVTSENYLFSVFNRWGELLFETEEVTHGWNGYYRGRICQQDVYVWRVRGEYVSGEKFTKVGDVTLIQ
ncbi:MAG: PKD domain-containing protein [Flavobacteriales bacterium]|nr:PKD domain-containing protein [Flavobacteriales bacterium]